MVSGPIEHETLECWFCQAEAEGTEDAIAKGWVPSYWDGECEVGGPVCVACQTKHLTITDDGWELKGINDASRT